MVIEERRTPLNTWFNGQPSWDIEECDRPSPGSVMIFDLEVHSFHPTYIQYIIRHWHFYDRVNSLTIVVSPEFLALHTDVVELVNRAGYKNIQFMAIAPPVAAQIQASKPAGGSLLRAFQEWRILCEYAQKIQASHCLVLDFDRYQIPLLMGQISGQKPPCPISGIYLRPSFHYPHVLSGHWNWQERLQQWHERILLRKVLRHPQLHTLFNLDPWVGKYVDRFTAARKSKAKTGAKPAPKTVALANPVQITTVAPGQVRQLRQRLAIESGRQVFLLFGTLHDRKGIYQLLAAIALLPEELSQKICLVLAGQARLEDQVQLLCQIELLLNHSAAQIISHYEFIPEAEVSLYFQLADVILAPHQKPIGMSGLLSWAAAAQKPVLSSNYGLIGELVRRYRLGLTVDSSQPSAIADGLAQFLRSSPLSLGDPQQMQWFALQNSAENFARTLCQNIMI
jgi:glycosyltransferase involved in cell wall biosynthesis